MWRDVAWLFDIVQAATKARAYVAGMDLEDFRRSSLHRDAVLRQLEIIGEATKRLSEETRDRYPSVAWRNVKRARFARRVLHGIRHETREVFPEIRMYLYPIMHQHFTDLLPYLPIDDPSPPVEEYLGECFPCYRIAVFDCLDYVLRRYVLGEISQNKTLDASYFTRPNQTWCRGYRLIVSFSLQFLIYDECIYRHFCGWVNIDVPERPLHNTI